LDRVTLASVQQRTRLHSTIDEYRDDLRRFLRVAQGKHAQLVLFPELGGALVAPPLLRDFRSALLKRADRGRRPTAPLWARWSGALASRAAGWFGADLRENLRALLNAAAPQLWNSYSNLFSELAREFQVVIVGPSAYLPDPVDQRIRNLAAVFSPDGALLGHQAKVILHPEDEGLAEAGESWTPIVTPVGVLGLMLGGDVLYPEVGRLLAYQGAEALILLGACSTAVLYQKLRAGILARMQDNQLFAAASFLVGANDLSRDRQPLLGKSAILAPQELTPRFSGILVEMGSQRSEGVLTAEWDYNALRKLWEQSDTPLRRQLPLAQAGQTLARLYERLKSLPRSLDSAFLSTDEEAVSTAGLLPVADHPLSLDELPVISVVTRRWSGVRSATPPVESPLDLSELPEHLGAANLPHPSLDHAAFGRPDLQNPGEDDETDEMDALPDQTSSQPS
jgi:predicted amidohydrolase